MKYLKPNTPEWFAAMQSASPQQAAHTKQIVSLAGNVEACSVCGDEEAKPYKALGVQFSTDVGASIQLCDDCKGIRESAGEKFAKM